MIEVILASAWGICILLALIGWGTLLNRLFVRETPFDWAQRAVYGIAVNVFIGGLLNLTGLVSRWVVLASVGLGFIFWVAGLVRQRGEVLDAALGYLAVVRRKPLLLLCAGAVLGLLVLQFFASAYGTHQTSVLTPYSFNAHDDYFAYFAYPRQMIDAGAMSADPFGYRRLTTALGGQSYLDTFVLAMLAEENLHLVDPGLGLVIVAGLLWAFLSRAGASEWIRLACVGAFLLIPPPTVNLTSLVIGMALFLGLFRCLDWPGLAKLPLVTRASLIALLVATLFALKSSFIPAAVLTLAVSYALASDWLRRWRAVLPEVALVTGIGILLLAPWMVLLHRSSGTLLYPLLGSGYHEARYGTILLPYAELTFTKAARILLVVATSASFVALVIAGLPALARYRGAARAARTIDPHKGDPLNRHAMLAVWAGAISGSLVVHLLFGGFDAFRFTYPFVHAAIFLLIGDTVARWPQSASDTHGPWVLSALAVLAAGILLGSGWNDARAMYVDALTSVRQAIDRHPLVTPGEREKYAQMQRAVPPGEPILTRLEKPFLLDFRRNPIYLVDQPGVSPPPGMPFHQGSEPLANYLLGQRIRHVAFSYANDAGYSRRSAMLRSQPDTNTLTRTEAQNVLVFHDQLLELGKTRKRVYDDGENFVLDLLAPGP